MLYGAIIGDIAGSMYEGSRYNITEPIEFFGQHCRFTDDTVMTLAVAQSILKYVANGGSLFDIAVRQMQEFGRQYPHGYGKEFRQWIWSDNPEPYDSWGNGAPMRVSPCAWVGRTLDDVLSLAHEVTVVSHTHPEAIKGAKAIASAIFLARTGKSKDEICQHITQNYYPMDFTLDTIDDEYRYGCSSQLTVPYALQAFFESESFEDAIRKAISIGGDCDTNASMAGAIAEAYYGVPDYIVDKLDDYLTVTLNNVLQEFNKTFGGQND